MSEGSARWQTAMLDESSVRWMNELLESRTAPTDGIRCRRLTHDEEGCHE